MANFVANNAPLNTLPYNVYYSAPFSSPYITSEDKKKKIPKINAIGAGMILTATLAATQPVFADMPNLQTKVLKEVATNPLVENLAPGIQKAIIETQPNVVEQIRLQIDRNASSVSNQVKKEIDDLDKISVLSDAKKQVVSAPSVQAKTIEDKTVLDPDALYKEHYTVANTDKPLVMTIKQSVATKIQNTLERPIPRASYTEISSPFGPRNLDGKAFHHGVDYPAPIGTPIYAAADGKVIYSGQAGGYGNWIVLEHEINGLKFYTIYGHMGEKDLLVKEGETVKKGQNIARVNEKGEATGPHLHFSVAFGRDVQNPRLFYDYVNPTFAVDMEKSDNTQYAGYVAPKKLTPSDYWKMAQEAGKQTGWDPIFIYSQWEIETGHFTSNVLRNDNNIAGQTWQNYMPENMKGSERPKDEGGNYIHYQNAVDGYVDFIKKNPRYSDVKEKPTPEAQAKEVAQQGWAKDPVSYEQTLDTQIAHNKQVLPPVKSDQTQTTDQLSDTKTNTDDTSKKDTTTGNSSDSKSTTNTDDASKQSTNDASSDSKNSTNSADTSKQSSATTDSSKNSTSETTVDKTEQKPSDTATSSAGKGEKDTKTNSNTNESKKDEVANDTSKDSKTEVKDDSKKNSIVIDDPKMPFIMKNILKPVPNDSSLASEIQKETKKSGIIIDDPKMPFIMK